VTMIEDAKQAERLLERAFARLDRLMRMQQRLFRRIMQRVDSDRMSDARKIIEGGEE
jgi:hypothetical protein